MTVRRVIGLVASLAVGLTAAAPLAPAAPSPTVACSGGALDKPLFRRTPSSCTFSPFEGPLGYTAHYYSMRWRGFGSSSATATGRIVGTKVGDPSIPMTLFADRLGPDRCHRGHRVYRRLRVTNKYGTFTQRTIC